MGLTEDMCYFIYEPDDIKDNILFDWDSTLGTAIRKDYIRNAYEWVMENHTYDIRAAELVIKFEEFKSGMRKKSKYMGYALHSDIKIEEGELIYKEVI